jgi:hypothetical protein
LEKSISAQVPLWFEGRILPVTLAIAERWGELDGIRQLAGRPLNAPEGMIAATALEHHLTMVTRNVKDFAGLGVALINSWLDHFRLIQPVDGAWPAKHAGQSYRIRTCTVFHRWTDIFSRSNSYLARPLPPVPTGSYR